jgi:formate C-acetyltransferase
VRGWYEEEAIPFWRGRTMRDRIFAAMTPEWLAAYEAGVFTEFMEQRAPGHTVLDDKIYRKGMLDFEQDILAALGRLDFLGDPQAWARQQELAGMRVAVRGLIRFAERHAEHAEALAAAAPDPQRRAELEQIAAVCRWVPAHAPRSFHEALQYYWFVHLGVVTELNTWDAFNPGHIDQHLLPFYRAGLADGSLTQESARELLQCFWIKFNNQPAPPKVGVTAAESGTYTDFALLNTGGLTPSGDDATSELTYLVLDVIQDLRLLQPSSCVLVSRKNPDRLLRRAGKIIRTGYGQPSLFNHDAIVQELVRHGKSIEDARAGGASGCVEVGAFGKENYNLTGYFNLPKVLELALHDGIDPRSGVRVGISTGEAAAFRTFDEVFAAFEKQLAYLIDVKIRGSNVIERLYAQHMPAPFLSVLIDDCVAKGKDYHDGGARYDSSYIQGVGVGTITDALTAFRYTSTTTAPSRCRSSAPFSTWTSRALKRCASSCSTARPSTATTTTTPMKFCAACSRHTSRPSTEDPIPAGGGTASTCCPPPCTCISAPVPAPPPMGATPPGRSPRASRRYRARTATAPRPCSAPRPRSTTSVPAVRCSTRSWPPNCSAPMPTWTSSCSWYAPTSDWMATTSSSTWWTPQPCAPPRRTRTPTAT